MGAISTLLGWAFGSIEGIATVVMLVSLGRWVRKGAVVGELLSTGGVFLILVGVLALAGVLDVHVGVLGSMLKTGFDMASSLLGSFL